MSAIPHIVVCGRRYSREEWEAVEADLPMANSHAHIHAAVERTSAANNRRGFDGMRDWLRKSGASDDRARTIATATATKHDRSR